MQGRTVRASAQMTNPIRLFFGTDARTVRPYMHSNGSLHQAYYTVVRTASCKNESKKKLQGRTVRVSTQGNLQTYIIHFLERTHGPCIPTCIQTVYYIRHITWQYGLHHARTGARRSCRDARLVRPLKVFYTKYVSFRLPILPERALHSRKMCIFARGNADAQPW